MRQDQVYLGSVESCRKAIKALEARQMENEITVEGWIEFQKLIEGYEQRIEWMTRKRKRQ